MSGTLKKLVWPVMAAPVIYLALSWKKLPEKVAVHFDLNGNPDRFGNKSELLWTALILIATNVLVYLILTNIYRIDPKKYAAENKERLVKIGFAVALFISAILCLVIYSASRGNMSFKTGLIFSATGLLFAVIGNYMPNLKPNYFAGFRLPWTLENEENWRKTHALGGKLWFGSGMLLAIICLFVSSKTAIIIFFAVMLIIVLIPIIFSFRLYQQQKRNKIPGNTDKPNN